MLQASIEDVGHGLEAAMRMVRRADRLVGAILGGAEVVEQQERIDVVELVSGEGTPHGESAALERLDGRNNGVDRPSGGDWRCQESASCERARAARFECGVIAQAADLGAHSLELN